MSKDYSYSDYLESGEVSNPFVAETPPETNEYTGNEYSGREYTDMFNSDNSENDSEFSKSMAKDTGIDLNDGAYGVASVARQESVGDILGEDLNNNGNEQLDSILDNFQGNKWSDLSLDEQKQSMTDLAGYVAADTGNKNPPEVVFRDDMVDGTYGGYNPETNTMEINENMLDNSEEAADTIAHEMWHAHQQQEAQDPNSEKGHEYQDGFDNYISPEYDFEGYQNQMVEAEARDYAQGFKDRLAGIKGGV